MVVAQRRIEGSRSPATRARLDNFHRIAAITSPVRVGSPSFIRAPSIVWLSISIQFYQIVLHCLCLDEPSNPRIPSEREETWIEQRTGGAVASWVSSSSAVHYRPHALPSATSRPCF